jgi:DNA-binding response OmpR family regulator
MTTATHHHRTRRRVHRTGNLEIRPAELQILIEGTVDVAIHRVRAKLGRIAPDWHYIHTHFGIGYRFAPERLERPSALPARSAAGD